MSGRKRSEIPESLETGHNRFEDWRRNRKPGSRIRDPLWALAVKLADAHGVSRTASTLRLDYQSLKKRLAAMNGDSVSTPGAFLELSPASLSPAAECVIEFEDGTGASMRVQLRGGDVPDLVALGRSFWSGE